MTDGIASGLVIEVGGGLLLFGILGLAGHGVHRWRQRRQRASEAQRQLPRSWSWEDLPDPDPPAMLTVEVPTRRTITGRRIPTYPPVRRLTERFGTADFRDEIGER